MSNLASVVAVACASALICTLVSNFVSNTSAKRIINLVLGAFIICCIISPVKNAFSAIKNSSDSASEITVQGATDDEAYNKLILRQTQENLENTLSDLLYQNGVGINRCEIILALRNETSIIISSISIYISDEYIRYANLIENVTFQNFGITPNIITE